MKALLNELLFPVISKVVLSGVNPFAESTHSCVKRIIIGGISFIFLITSISFGAVALYHYLAAIEGQLFALLSLGGAFLGMSGILCIASLILKPKKAAFLKKLPDLEKSFQHALEEFKDHPFSKNSVLPILGILGVTAFVAYLVAHKKD